MNKSIFMLLLFSLVSFACSKSSSNKRTGGDLPSGNPLQDTLTKVENPIDNHTTDNSVTFNETSESKAVYSDMINHFYNIEINTPTVGSHISYQIEFNAPQERSFFLPSNGVDIVEEQYKCEFLVHEEARVEKITEVNLAENLMVKSIDILPTRKTSQFTTEYNIEELKFNLEENCWFYFDILKTTIEEKINIKDFADYHKFNLIKLMTSIKSSCTGNEVLNGSACKLHTFDTQESTYSIGDQNLNTYIIENTFINENNELSTLSWMINQELFFFGVGPHVGILEKDLNFENLQLLPFKNLTINSFHIAQTPL